MAAVTNADAARLIRAHHAELQEALQGYVRAVRTAVGADEPFEPARDAMVEFLDDELLPHAAAEESVLYTAGDRDPTALLVRAMREEHVSLKTWVPHLRGAADGLTAASTALAIEALFETHLWKENELLLPALLTNPAVDLGEALLGMHDLLG